MNDTPRLNHYQHAQRAAGPLAAATVAAASGIGATGLAAWMFPDQRGSALLLMGVGTALLGHVAVAWLCRRYQGRFHAAASAGKGDGSDAAVLAAFDRMSVWQTSRGDLLLLMAQVIAGLCLVAAWSTGLGAGAPLLALGAIGGAFALLVLRAGSGKELPGRDVLDGMAAALVLTAAGALFGTLDPTTGLGAWPIAGPLQIAASAVTGILIVETVARTLLHLAVSSEPPVRHRQALLSIILPGRGDRQRGSAAIEDMLGVDLARHWIISWFGRHGVLLICAALAVTWLSSGLRSVAYDERALVERFGSPNRLVGPGLVVDLPWPFTRVRAIRSAALHRVIVADGSDVSMDVIEVEAPSSPDDDRLWAVAHPREILFLTPAGTTGDQDLRRQVAPMSADLVVEYRVRDSDEAVLQALTSVDDPRTLVVTLARRAIQRQCAQTTAQELISTDRAAFANSIANAIQKDLDRLQTGLVVTGIDAEAIHPPVEAADSFITAQTAELEAKAAIDLARANAAILLAMAGQDAAEIRNKAQAAALETVAAARVETFESQALTRARSSRAEPIDLELAVEAFTEAWANRPLTVIDHRLEAPAGHRIQLEDLRQ